MPSVNNEGLGEAAAADTVASESASSAAASPAPRRRRGGRRVVRGAGAAGAAVEMTVQEHTPLFAEPRVPVLDPPAPPAAPSRRASAASSASADRDADASEDRPSAASPESGDEERPTRTRRRTRASRAADEARDESRDESPREDDEPAVRTRSRRRTASADETFSSREETVDDMPRNIRPMTSLLFQEPVIVARPSRDDEDDEVEETPRRRRSRRAAADDDRAERAERPSRSSRASRDARDDDRDDDRRNDRNDRDDDRADDRASRDTRDDRDDRDADEAREERPSRRSRRRRASASASDDRRESAESPRDDRADDQSADADERDGRAADRGESDGETSGRSRRSRRLNAQERRAAAEVEQIEEDLELDEITYAPITEEDLSEGPTRSRRRRRRGAKNEAEREAEVVEELVEQVVEGEDASRRRRGESEGEDEDSTVTRRRRRRRSRSGEEPAEEATPRRSRKQQYIDEITDIEGSTRLEAKKQRRRDNRRERSRQSQLMEQDFLARREKVERLMVVRERGRHTQISVIEDNVLVEHYVSDIQEVATVGNVYLGRVQNVLPSMEAAFVDIGQARNGVLYAGEVNWDATRLEGQPRRIELAFKSGDPVLVQVTKDPIGHKGARLTSQVTLAGRFLVLVPSGGMTGVSRKLSERERSRLKNIVSKIAPKDMGVIIRTAAEGASEEAIVKDLENLVRQWERICAKRDEFWHGRRPKLLQGEPDVAIRVVRDIFNDDFTRMIVEGDKVYERIEEYLETMAPDLRDKLERWDPAEHEGKDVFDRWQIDSQLRKGMERQVYLPSGGSIVIDRTEAMTTIDVNTGRFIGKGKSLEETVTRCNLEAAEEIARQLRLRDIGGMVMIDFVDMVMPANRDLVLRRLVECLARDRTKHQVAEVTSLGLVQMTRKRIGQGLVEAFSEECPTCKGRGFILHEDPTVSADYDDPYALKGGDPFVKTNKHGRGSDVQVPQGSSADVKAKLAQIAAAAVAATGVDD
ncbi:Rne/Rng family ribonuclease [Bifidobacterium samirii]|uniref:Ribonuclease E n=1 Tax=Bifidobacterium samirii TaxID=2306974 RepID=A0A430FR10_9BIFI|nr:Rne/Rng family ribonuclease [Bifidobacterium samirii]RSX55260.1 ribonuclease G [Bifidobacterium samirii]